MVILLSHLLIMSDRMKLKRMKGKTQQSQILERHRREMPKVIGSISGNVHTINLKCHPTNGCIFFFIIRYSRTIPDIILKSHREK